MHLAIATSYFPVLSQTFVLNQITSLLDAGHEVTILARRSKEDEAVHREVDAYGLRERTIYWDGENPANPLRRAAELLALTRRAGFSSLWKRRGLALRRLRRARRLSEAPAFDAVVCHFGTLGVELQGLRELGVLESPLAIIFHGHDMSRTLCQKGEHVYDELLARGDLFLPISEFWRRKLLDLGADAEKTVVHHMGIDPQRFAFRPRQRGEGEAIRLLSIGRFVEKKGFAVGIEAFAGLAGKDPRLELTLVGDGELRPQLEETCQELGLAERVHFHGSARGDEVEELLYDHHVLLAPSLRASDGDMEGIPVVLMEAMATGMPIVTTDHSGIPELVRHGESGFLAREADVDDLAAQLSAMVGAEDRWEEFGAFGRSTVEESFSLHELNAELVDLLKRRFG